MSTVLSHYYVPGTNTRVPLSQVDPTFKCGFTLRDTPECNTHGGYTEFQLVKGTLQMREYILDEVFETPIQVSHQELTGTYKDQFLLKAALVA